MNRLYLMTRVGLGTGKLDPYNRPNHTVLVGNTWLINGLYQYQAMDCGLEPVLLVYILGIDQTNHDLLVADTTVFPFAEDIDSVVGANLTALQDALEFYNLPGSNVVSAGNTYRQVIRAVIILFQLQQRINGMGGGSLFAAGVTLNTTWNLLPSTTQNAILAMAASFNFVTTGLSGTTTLRVILRNMYLQWPSGAVFFSQEF